MQTTFQGIGLRGPAVRTTQPITIHVEPAPEAGKPVGFRPGDVGDFSLSAEVEPRVVEAGGAVAVRVVLRRTGNRPSTLATPSRTGIEWLDPEVRDERAHADQEAAGAGAASPSRADRAEEAAFRSNTHADGATVTANGGIRTGAGDPREERVRSGCQRAEG